MIPSYATAFLAGLVTFLAPCTLPLVPAYLGFLSGTGAGEGAGVRRRVMRTAVLFVLGFSVVFVILGSAVGLVGTSVGPARILIQRVGGVVVILFGLVMLGILRVPLLQRSFQFKVPALVKIPAGPRAFLFGAILASGWTPCVGPILGTVLFLAASTATVATGAVLLGVFSVGLAIPFLLVALFYSRAARIIQRIAPLSRGIEVVAGLLLLFIGYLFVTDRMAAFIGSAYRVLDFINYDAIYRFL